jgi:hypothetical protein
MQATVISFKHFEGVTLVKLCNEWPVLLAHKSPLLLCFIQTSCTTFFLLRVCVYFMAPFWMKCMDLCIRVVLKFYDILPLFPKYYRRLVLKFWMSQRQYFGNKGSIWNCTGLFFLVVWGHTVYKCLSVFKLMGIWYLRLSQIHSWFKLIFHSEVVVVMAINLVHFWTRILVLTTII